MGQLAYYDTDDIKALAATCRKIINTDKKLKVSDMSNFLKNNEPTNRKVNSDSRDIYVKYFDDISSYRELKSEINTSYYSSHPMLTYEDGYDYYNYIFAGWFTTEDLTKSVSSSTTSGGAYAKFINADTLQALFQVSNGTTAESESTSLGILLGVCDLKLSKLAVVYEYGSNKNIITSTKVYTAMTSANGKIYAKAFNNKFSNVTRIVLNNLPNQLFSTPIHFKTGFVTQDSTLVLSTAQISKVENSFFGKRMVPVVFSCNKPITEAYFDILYDTSCFDFVDFYEGLNINNISINKVYDGKLQAHINFSEEMSGKFSPVSLNMISVLDESTGTLPNKSIFKVSNVRLYNGAEQVLTNSIMEPFYISPFETVIVTPEATSYNISRRTNINENNFIFGEDYLPDDNLDAFIEVSEKLDISEMSNLF